MAEFFGNIEKLTLKNKHYRKVLGTTSTMQLVVMNLEPLEEIGEEVHENGSQFIRVESGECLVTIGSEKSKLRAEEAIIIPPGATHNVSNLSKTDPLKLYSIYSPPEHKPACTQHKKYDVCK